MQKNIEYITQCTLSHNLHDLTEEGLQEYLICKAIDEDCFHDIWEDCYGHIVYEYDGSYQDFKEWQQAKLINKTLFQDQYSDIKNGKNTSNKVPEIKFVSIDMMQYQKGEIIILTQKDKLNGRYSIYHLSRWACGLKIFGVSGFTSSNSELSRALIVAKKGLISPELYKKLGIPKEIIHRTNFAGKYQFTLIQWVSRSSEARDLLYNNPVLLWMMIVWAVNNKDNGYGCEYDGCEHRDNEYSNGIIFPLLHLKQKEILSQLFGRGSKSDIKLLRKIARDNQNTNFYSNLVSLIQNPEQKESKLARQWSTIDISVLHSLTKYISTSNFFGLPILKLLNQAPDTWIRLAKKDHLAFHLQSDNPSEFAISLLSKIRHFIEDSFRMSKEISEQVYLNTHNCLKNAKTISRIIAVHDEVLKNYNSHDLFRNSINNFSEQAPLKGTQSIIPISNRKDLYDEGKTMHHCVSSYANSIALGNCWIYQILEPERATLELLPKTKTTIQEQQLSYKVNSTANHYYQIGQLYGACNKSVSTATRNRIQKWLDKTPV